MQQHHVDITVAPMPALQSVPILAQVAGPLRAFWMGEVGFEALKHLVDYKLAMAARGHGHLPGLDTVAQNSFTVAAECLQTNQRDRPTAAELVATFSKIRQAKCLQFR